MNTLKIYPKKFRQGYIQNIKNAGIAMPPEKYHNSVFIISFFIAFVSLFLFYFIGQNLLYSLGVFIVMNIFFYFNVSLKALNRIKKMESFFPDLLSLMSSNLKSGVTIEKAFLLSARPEFDPLDKEVLGAGKEISTGKDVISSMKRMSEKINSEKISKVVSLIISGLKAGGNIADLLEQTSINMKEKEVIERKTASTTLMYVIFIFFAVSVGAPVLFGLSSVLVEIVINLSERVPDLSGLQSNLPFTFRRIPISLDFIMYFAVSFLVITDLISCFVIGLVRKGEGKSGLKFFIPLLAISLTIFFLVRTILAKSLLDVIQAF